MRASFVLKPRRSSALISACAVSFEENPGSTITKSENAAGGAEAAGDWAIGLGVGVASATVFGVTSVALTGFGSTGLGTTSAITGGPVGAGGAGFLSSGLFFGLGSFSVAPLPKLYPNESRCTSAN